MKKRKIRRQPMDKVDRFCLKAKRFWKKAVQIGQILLMAIGAVTVMWFLFVGLP